MYNQGNITVVFDELGKLGVHITPFHDRLIRMGRSRGIGVWTCIQRPAFISNYILSESEHHFIFKLQLEADRKKVEGIIGEQAQKLNNLEKYHYIYSNSYESPRICKPIKH